MQTIEIIYLSSSAIAVFAMVPQIKQLLVTRQTDELSLSSWLAWLGNQIVALFYAISIHAVPYVIINFAWIAFYMIMIYLIFKYRNQPSGLQELSVETVSVSSK